MATIAEEIIEELKSMASESIRKVLLNHGAINHLGVKVEDLKKIQKRIKKDYELSMALYDTGISDAMYLAGLIADESKMSKKDIQNWAEKATWSMISDYTVPWVAAESKYGYELALEWIDSDKELIASAGWATLSGLMALKEDSEIDLKEIKNLLKRVEKEIHSAPNRVRYTMNSFIISVGSYVSALTEEALKVGKAIGKVNVNVGNTSCKVPFAPDYINKVIEKGTVGKKRKTVKC